MLHDFCIHCLQINNVMKLTLLFAIILVFNLHQVNGQSFTLTNGQNPISNGQVIEITAPLDVTSMRFYAFLINVSSETRQVKVRKTELELIPNTFNSFCWAKSCFPPDVFVSPDALELPAGDTTTAEDFYGEYFPQNQQGTTKVRYTFFDTRNYQDSISVVVHYTAGATGIPPHDDAARTIISPPFPNPSSDIVSFEIALPSFLASDGADLIIRNMLGSIVIMQRITDSGIIRLPVNTLREGIYFYSLVNITGQPLHTGKLIIKR